MSADLTQPIQPSSSNALNREESSARSSKTPLDLDAFGEDFVKGKKNGINMTDLKLFASHLKGIKKELNKEDLVKAIFQRLRNSETLQTILTTKAARVLYRKDKHTFPRMWNILLRYPDALTHTELQSSRSQLQYGESPADGPLFLEALAEFKDPNCNCGGNISPENVHLKDIDPTVLGEGEMTKEMFYMIFNDTCRLFKCMWKNYDVFGKNYHKDFWECCVDTDVYYMYAGLVKSNNQELFSFCSDGGELPTSGRVETFRSPNSSGSSLPKLPGSIADDVSAITFQDSDAEDDYSEAALPRKGKKRKLSADEQISIKICEMIASEKRRANENKKIGEKIVQLNLCSWLQIVISHTN